MNRNKMYKQALRAVTILLAVALSIATSSCSNKIVQQDNAENVYNELSKYGIQQYYYDGENINEIIDESYDINALNEYFVHPNLSDESFGHSLNLKHSEKYDFDSINRIFPIECVRYFDKNYIYTPYNVIQGGRFFIFWTLGDNNLYASNSIYIRKLHVADDFSDIKRNISTYKDVLLVDESSDLNLMLSSGIFSYSLLSNNTIMEIEYDLSADLIRRAENNIDVRLSAEDLIVKSKHIVNYAPSCISHILKEDLMME